MATVWVNSKGERRVEGGNAPWPVGQTRDGRTLYSDGSSGWSTWTPVASAAPNRSSASPTATQTPNFDMSSINSILGGNYGYSSPSPTTSSSGEYSARELSSITGIPESEFWSGKEIDYGGQRYKVIDTGRGTRQLQPISNPTRSGVPTADDILKPVMDKIKDQVSFLKDYTSKNPFIFDETLARTMAKEKYKPYYTEVLADFVNPLKEQITRSTSDETRALGELTRQTNLGLNQKNRDLQDALDMANEGFAGSGLLGSGVANRAVGRTKIQGDEAIQDFADTQKFREQSLQTTAERERSDINRLISNKERDIFGTGREYDTKVAQDVEAQKGQNQKIYSNKLLEAVTSRYGSPMTDINQFLNF